jgi:hypothetical protein
MGFYFQYALRKKKMEDNGKSSMDAWRYLAKKYPDKKHWCLP